tara:strand:+ start:2314 stop:3540 length:1227 start_codon:yes stop_codon:yes gene_type:complete
MASDDSIGIIELGNLSIRCIIFRIKSDNISEILSSSINPSEGIHNGVITNIKKAATSIRTCISLAEKEAEVTLKKINVILEQPEFLCTVFSKHRKINGSKIQKDDIDFLITESKKQVLLNDNKQSIIHIFNHNYIVDGKAFIEEPIDVYADHLSHEMTFVTMPKNNIKNINQVLFECDIEVERFISGIFTLGISLLSSNELKIGSLLIDVGFEKTSAGFFKNLALIHSFSVPIGINHLIKDISKVCSLSYEESKAIIEKIDLSFNVNQELFDEKDNLKNFYFTNTVFRKISKSLIFNVVKARLDEIFEITKKQAISNGFNINFDKNIFITGGGSNLCNLEIYCSNFFDKEVKNLVENKKIKDEYISKNGFAACLGALELIKNGWETEAIPKLINKQSKKISLLSKIFG